MLASGELRRRAASDAGANRSFASERRQFRPMNRGISAGSKAMDYRQTLASDAAAMSAPGPENAYLQAIAQDMQARAEYDQAATQERRSLLGSLLDTDATARTSDLSERDDNIYRDLAQRKRQTESRLADYQRRSGLFGALTGLF